MKVGKKKGVREIHGRALCVYTTCANRRFGDPEIKSNVKVCATLNNNAQKRCKLWQETLNKGAPSLLLPQPDARVCKPSLTLNFK